MADANLTTPDLYDAMGQLDAALAVAHCVGERVESDRTTYDLNEAAIVCIKAAKAVIEAHAAQQAEPQAEATNVQPLRNY